MSVYTYISLVPIVRLKIGIQIVRTNVIFNSNHYFNQNFFVKKCNFLWLFLYIECLVEQNKNNLKKKLFKSFIVMKYSSSR